MRLNEKSCSSIQHYEAPCKQINVTLVVSFFSPFNLHPNHPHSIPKHQHFHAHFIHIAHWLHVNTMLCRKKWGISAQKMALIWILQQLWNLSTFSGKKHFVNQNTVTPPCWRHYFCVLLINLINCHFSVVIVLYCIC